MRVLYFAWVRQRVGIAEENLDAPPEIETVRDLIEWLKTRGDAYAYAFADLRLIRAAVNQTHVKLDHALKGAREIAFFPPVTGG
jgi:molybdopterin synthase sulfur carrier subunit